MPLSRLGADPAAVSPQVQLLVSQSPCTWSSVPTPYLEVLPDISHGALDKQFPRLLLEGRPPHIKAVHICKIVGTADVHPVPR